MKKPVHPPMPRATAVVVAAGSASRMRADKLFLMLADRPVLAWSLGALERAASIERIVIVTRPDRIVAVQDACHEFGITKAGDVIPGGSTRARSVLAGVEAAGEAALLAIHDGARPFVPPALIDALVMAADECGAAAPGVPVKDTIKQIDAEGFVLRTPDRGTLRAIQTPQVFDAALLRRALRLALERGLDPTDDCAAVESFGAKVHILEGDEMNFKLTTPADFALAETIIMQDEQELFI